MNIPKLTLFYEVYAKKGNQNKGTLNPWLTLKRPN